MSTNEENLPQASEPEKEKEDKKYRASSAVTLKTLSAWDQARLSPWYHPRFWLDLLTHPSAEYKMNHVRRRARLFSLVALCFLVCGIIANGIAYKDQHSHAILGVQLLANLLMLLAYALSRTKFATLGKSLGIFTVWLLVYLCTVINLRNGGTETGDVTVTDSINWLFTPAWYVMAAIFLSRSMTMFILLLDATSLFFMPLIGGSTFYSVRKVLFFHMVNGILLLLASIIAFRDKLQLYSQHDGQVHEDQHRAGTLSRLILQPHKDITDRIFRRRARILSAFHLGLIPFAIVWASLESTGWLEGAYDAVIIALASCVVFASLGLYVLSRTQYSRWASRLTIAMLLALPYVYNRAPTTSVEGTLYANLITISSSAILGVTLLSGPELVALSGIVFFFNLYSPVFPPHIVLSLILLAASLVYRRDIKEIHDTAFHRDDLYEDDSGDLLIPWEKKYFFNMFSYIQMVTTYYIIVFGVMVLLGITAAIAAAVSPSLPYKAIEATLVAPGQPSTYVLLVHTRNCPSLAPQTFKVVGTLGRFQFVHNQPLGSNTSTTISLNTPSLIGDIAELGFFLGNGNYYINQYDQCALDTLEIWDSVREKAFTSDVLDGAAAEGSGTSTQGGISPSAPLRKLLGFGNDLFFDPFCEFGFRGFDCDKARTDNRASICAKFLSIQSQSMLSWEKSLCIAQEIAQDICTGNYAAILCYLAGTCTSPIGGCCSGHGTCTVSPNKQYLLRGDISFFMSLTKGVVFCKCDPMYSGTNCSIPVGAVTCNNATLNRYSYDGTCDLFFPAGDPSAGAVNQTLQRVVDPAYADGKRKIDDSPGNADFLAANKFPQSNQANKPAQNMFAIGLWEYALSDIVQISQNKSNVYKYGSKKQFTLLRDQEFAASTPSTAAQYANNQSGWLDNSPIYGLNPAGVKNQTNPARLNEAAVTALFNQTQSKEYVTVARLLTRFHNKFAQLTEIYFCWSTTLNAVNNTCVSGNSSLIFEVSRFSTIRFLQALVEAELLPSFFYNATNPTQPFNAEDFPTFEAILSQMPGVEADFIFTPPADSTLGATFPTGTRLLPTALDWWLPVAQDASQYDNLTANPTTPYTPNNIDACTTNNYQYIANDDVYINTLYNLFLNPANGWASKVQGTMNSALLIETIERARDLGLGMYADYITNLNTQSSVNPGVELYLGANLETLGYPATRNRTGWSFASDYAQVVLALTVYQLHVAISEDRLSVLNDNQPPTNIVETYLNSAKTYCSTPPPNCPSQSDLAFRVLTGLNSPSGLYQGLYFSNLGTLQKLKSAVTVTLFYDQLNNHYNEFQDAGLPGLADDCIPDVLSLTPQDPPNNPCGCCFNNDGFSDNPGC